MLDIRFRAFLINLELAADSEQSSSLLTSLGFAESDVPKISNYFASILIELERETNHGQARIACFDGAENLKGPQIRAVYNSLLSTDHRKAWGDDDVEIQQNRQNLCRAIQQRTH